MNFIKYDDWVKKVPTSIQEDSLWKMKVYQLSLFLGDIGWDDISTLYKDGRTKSLSNQLYRAVGSISANVAEGYSRGTGKDRARFYEYSLGSAREARDWYYKGRHLLGNEIINHRFLILTEIIKLLLTMVPEQRNYSVKEPDLHTESKLMNAPTFNKVN
ncbi:MAG: four helix bundle protein [Candidatus Marinimicrobia bacterium]|nr:four helix bundle protein [Candidatus Neomarinimicrobiota bacterium]MBL7030990.1 four helix bundle protein [Candidatus Neomarinimicrobiota bacterium]